MALQAAEQMFRQGLTELKENRPLEASRHFREAMMLERKHAVPRPQMRYLSYYGLSIARASRPTPEAIRACETALQMDSYSPDLHLNLGRVLLMAGRTTRALAVLEQGLRMAPAHPQLQVELSLADRRAPAPLPWLPRNHPINRWAGRVRSRWARRRIKI